ncbi:MAG: hypothetical protein ACFFFH_09490 [Candidatus Thorarchaeota archaeon]
MEILPDFEKKKEVYLTTFSCARASFDPKLPDDTLIKEVKEAMKVLGVPEKYLINRFLFEET